MFKKGDRVKCIAIPDIWAEKELKLGSIYTVINKIGSGLILVGCQFSHELECFKLNKTVHSHLPVWF